MRTHIPGSREGEPRGSPPRLSSQSVGLLPEGRTHGPQEGRAESYEGGAQGQVWPTSTALPQAVHLWSNYRISLCLGFPS